MEQPQYLIDTNVVIDYMGQKLPPSGMDFISKIIDIAPKVSVITKIEVLGYNAAPEYYQLLSDFITDTEVFDLTKDIVDASIGIRKNKKTKLPDVIIAATAIANNLILVTGMARILKTYLD